MTDLLMNPGRDFIRLPEPESGRFRRLLRQNRLPATGFPADREGIEISIAPGSERLQKLIPFREPEESDFQNIPLLIKAKGKCTTDHISMAGPTQVPGTS